MNRYFGLCLRSIKSVLEDDISHNLSPHFWFAEEGDFASRVYHEIVKNEGERVLIQPYKSCEDCHATIHSLFPATLLLNDNERGFFDLAIVRQKRPARVKGSKWVANSGEWRADRFHQHKHDLIGMVEMKQDIGTDFKKDVLRIAKYLRKFPAAWGIMVVMYSWRDTKSKWARKGPRTLVNLRKNNPNAWNRFEFVTECSPAHKPWKPTVLGKSRFISEFYDGGNQTHTEGRNF